MLPVLPRRPLPAPLVRPPRPLALVGCSLPPVRSSSINWVALPPFLTGETSWSDAGSLIGLISLELGLTGELGGCCRSVVSIFFHLVDRALVTIGDGLGGFWLLGG